MNPTTAHFSILQKLLAWSVHLFTASGLVVGFLAILAINEMDWRAAMLWLVAALIIDGLDGTFARMAKVQEVLPNWNGKTMDYLIDFLTYAVIPAYFFHEAGLVSDALKLPCTIIILMVSILYYAREGMVSDDYYFIGFPVMWNMVIFYLVFVFSLDSMANALIVIFFAVLHFIPIKFVYPSRVKSFRKLTIAVSTLVILSFALILWYYPQKSFWFSTIAILSAVYYGLMAIYNTWFEKSDSHI